MYHRFFIIAIVIFSANLFCSALFALRPDPAESREIVIYTRAPAEIREVRTVSVEKGDGELLLPMIPGSALGNSIAVVALNGKGIETRSTAFAYDLIDDENMWERRIGETVELDVGDSVITGVLRRYTSMKFFLEPDPEKEPGRIIVIDAGDVADPVFDGLPGKLVTEPSVRWAYRAKKAGKVKIRLSYLTEGISWNAVYRADLEGGSAKLTGNTIIDNMTNLSLPYDKLLLVAGDIHLAGDRRRVDRVNPKPGASGNIADSQFGDIRRWVVDSPGVILTGHETVIPLIEVKSADVKTRYVYDAAIFNDRITTHLDLTLTAGDAVPLPGGNIRIYRRGADGELLFTGEDVIDDTPAGSPLDLTVAQAFDLTAERVRDLEEPMPDGGTRQRFRVTIGNSGVDDVTVEVLERLFGAWTVTSAVIDGVSVQHEIKDARTAKFIVDVPQGKTVELEYEIVYSR